MSAVKRYSGYKYSYPRKRGPRRYGSYAGSKGKGKVAGQYVMGSSRGYLRRAGFYGRYSNGGELKFHDIDVDDAIVATGGSIQNGGTINIIPQGVLENTRVGRKCTIKAINWRYVVSVPAVDATGAAREGDVVRMILYVDKQTNGATAAVLDILQTADFQSFNNLSNKGRFRILMDRTHVVNYLSGTGSGGAADNDYSRATLTGSYYKKCAIPIEYDDSASTGVLTTIRTNNLCCLFISEQGIAGVASKFRLRFSDA